MRGFPWLRPALILCAALGLAACARDLTGIPQAPGAAHPALQQLARLADAGDKKAQLTLGILYEEGRYVPPDWARAEKLYAAAAVASGGTIYVYQPPVGKGAGRVVPINTGPRQEGLAEAARRLARLKKRKKSCPDCI